MTALDRDLLLVLISLAAFLLVLGIIAAVHHLWKMLRKDARWQGLQNPYGWPVELLGDIDAHTVDKSICKKRLRPSRLERNAKKFHEVLADVIPEPDAPPVPARVDSLTKQERQDMMSRINTTEKSSVARLSRNSSLNGQNRRGSGYREKQRTGNRPPESTEITTMRVFNEENVIVICDDNEPPPPYSEVRHNSSL